MNARPLLLLVVACWFAAGEARAYPPAPYHRVYGLVRDARGNALETGEGIVVLRGVNDVEIVRATTRATTGPGINYSLQLPMDSGTTAQLYSVTALRPLLPFTIRVMVDGVSHVPIQSQGATWTVGQPASQTRLDLTIGIDSDNDGLPDAWEQDVINSDPTGTLTTLADVRPGDDLDGDGLTNLDECRAGTYALATGDGYNFEFVELTGGIAHLRFLAITGHTYGIRYSTNLQQAFAPRAFSLSPTAQNPTAFHLATEVRVLDVYVAVGTEKRNFFRLHVQ